MKTSPRNEAAALLPANADIYLADLLRRYEEEDLLIQDSLDAGDAYLSELSRRLADADGNEPRSELAFDWIN